MGSGVGSPRHRRRGLRGCVPQSPAALFLLAMSHELTREFLVLFSYRYNFELVRLFITSPIFLCGVYRLRECKHSLLVCPRPGTETLRANLNKANLFFADSHQVPAPE